MLKDATAALAFADGSVGRGTAEAAEVGHSMRVILLGGTCTGAASKEKLSVGHLSLELFVSKYAVEIAWR